MPTPPAVIDAAQTIGDAYVAAAGFYDQVSLFVALAVGILFVGIFVRLVRKSVRG